MRLLRCAFFAPFLLLSFTGGSEQTRKLKRTARQRVFRDAELPREAYTAGALAWALAFAAAALGYAAFKAGCVITSTFK